MGALVEITPDLLALAKGEAGRLDDSGKARITEMICATVGLNPATVPIQWINLGGKLVPYFTKGATDQIRQNHGVSIEIMERKVENEMSVVRVRATTKDGRQDESIGAVSLAGLKGEALANALMKAETKAKRRCTLSIVGLGLLDESEMPDDRKASQFQLSTIKDLVIKLGKSDELMSEIREKYGSSADLTPETAELLINHLKQRLEGCSDESVLNGEVK